MTEHASADEALGHFRYEAFVRLPSGDYFSVGHFDTAEGAERWCRRLTDDRGGWKVIDQHTGRAARSGP